MHLAVQTVSLKIQHILISVDLYVIPLAGVDIVLGVQWLAQLGKVLFDYTQQTVEFTLAGQPVRLAMQLVATRASDIRADSEGYAIQVASQPRPPHSSQATPKRQLPAHDKAKPTGYLANPFLHQHLEDKMLPKGRGMLRPRVPALEVPHTPGSDNSAGVGTTGDNLRQPVSEEKHAAPVEAPPDMQVNQPSQHEPSEASASISMQQQPTMHP